MRVLNWLNRGLVVLVLTALLVGGLAASAAPATVANALRAGAGLLETAGFLAVAGVGVPLALIAAVLLSLELRVRPADTVALAGGSGARLAIETVTQRLRADVETVAEVDQARPTVRSRRGGKVDVDLAVTTSPVADVRARAGEIEMVARGTLESLGLLPGKVTVRLSHTRRAWPGARSQPEPASVEEPVQS